MIIKAFKGWYIRRLLKGVVAVEEHLWGDGFYESAGDA